MMASAQTEQVVLLVGVAQGLQEELADVLHLLGELAYHHDRSR